MNNGGGGVFFQGFKRDFKEWAGSASIIHKPTGLFVWAANSNSENDDIGAEGVFTGKAPPVMHAWDIAGGISREFVWNGVGPGSLGATTIWGGYTQDQDGLGGFTRTTVSSSLSGTASSYAVWDGEVSAGAFPGIPFTTEITSSETTKWYLAVDQAIDSAAMNVFIAYQHIEPEIKLVTRDPAFLRPAHSRTFRSRWTISTCSSWVAASSFNRGLAASIPRLRPSAIGRPQLSRMEVGMDVPPRDLICRPLAALKNNRAEAEERAAELSTVVTNGATNGAPAAQLPAWSLPDDGLGRLPPAQGGRRCLGDHFQSR